LRIWIGNGLVVITRQSRTGRIIDVGSASLRGLSAEARFDVIDRLEQSLMKRRIGEGKPLNRAPHADALDMLEKWPLLGSWFTDPTYEDGASRLGGWMSVTARLGHFRATLKEATEGAMLELAAPSFLTLLDIAEGALADPGTLWLADPKPFIPGGKKPQKGG
jgi:hypothetical protein